MRSMYPPPIDLSELQNLARVDTRPRVSAFVGRVSTKDNQDPTTSIPRQVTLASARLEEGEEFSAYFWDVESGMLPPELRGRGTHEMYAGLGVPTRRDGGLQDLLEQVEFLGITHVLAERSDRVARAMLTSLTFEHRLDAMGVEVVYANEPTGGTYSGRRRVRLQGQVDAELYREVMREMSMGGQKEHASRGWNHGYPPYPYATIIDPDAPVNTKGFDRRPKRKLVPHPDGRRFTAARELCRLRREEHLKSGEILQILRAEPDRYPGRWTHGLIEGLIANPKLSGYMVYNRRPTRTGKPGQASWNPITEWVWSPEPVHAAVVTLEEWKQAQVVTAALRPGVSAGPLKRIRAAARQRGLAVDVVETGDRHTIYRIGNRRVVLPNPIPFVLAQQIIDDLEEA
ncbi:recombinase family protein [Streptomyces sp. NPDC097619]|uniref:recombinase family protein n=1 Tax=Streptomyces sp. NPDC097619 TaxID=3157228 RepID=UPI00332DC232